jgi:glycolate oxidase FAD binding subunit
VSAESIAAAVKESHSSRTPTRIVGGGTWLDAGRPVRADKTLSVQEERGVVSYVPEDLTLTVRGGTSLSEIERITRERKQWLPLDPYGSADGTIGATIATASAGPLAATFGLPRDLLLGLEFVNGRGEIVRGGGKVVKNVAGFDLSRLMTGSWGTLGVITEVTVRLYALPEVDRSFAITLPGNEKQVASLISTIISAPLAPYALLLLNASVAGALKLGDNPVCLIRFGGNDAVVRAQTNALSRMARLDEIDGSHWKSLGQLEHDAHTVLRLSALPSRFLAVGAKILLDDIPLIRNVIDPRRGLLRLSAPRFDNESSPPTSVDLRVNANDGAAVVYEKLDAEVWPLVSPSVVSDALSQGIKRAYDPHNILNPGILGDLN